MARRCAKMRAALATVISIALLMSNYSLTWTCGDCKTQNERPLTKIEAAFCEALRIGRALHCRECGGGTVSSMSHMIPDADDPEVLQAWLDNRKLYFLEQDEDLFLASIDARRLVELLRDPATPRWRSRTLLSALINKVSAGGYSDAAEEKAAKGFLKENLVDWKGRKAIRFQARKAVLQALQEE